MSGGDKLDTPGGHGFHPTHLKLPCTLGTQILEANATVPSRPRTRRHQETFSRILDMYSDSHVLIGTPAPLVQNNAKDLLSRIITWTGANRLPPLPNIKYSRRSNCCATGRFGLRILNFGICLGFRYWDLGFDLLWLIFWLSIKSETWYNNVQRHNVGLGTVFEPMRLMLFHHDYPLLRGKNL